MGTAPVKLVNVLVSPILLYTGAVLTLHISVSSYVNAASASASIASRQTIMRYMRPPAGALRRARVNCSASPGSDRGTAFSSKLLVSLASRATSRAIVRDSMHLARAGPPYLLSACAPERPTREPRAMRPANTVDDTPPLESGGTVVSPSAGGLSGSSTGLGGGKVGSADLTSTVQSNAPSTADLRLSLHLHSQVLVKGLRTELVFTPTTHGRR